MHHRQFARSRGAPRGMTLIEVLMVVILIGITTAFVAPTIDVTTFRINGAMQSLGTTLLAVVLALDVFTVEDLDQGSTNSEDCGKTQAGRGCLFLTGGIIQRTRGAVELLDGHGYVKRYSYDACAAKSPPPYYPTTGHFAHDRYFEVDPTNFDVAAFFQMLSPHN